MTAATVSFVDAMQSIAILVSALATVDDVASARRVTTETLRERADFFPDCSAQARASGVVGSIAHEAVAHAPVAHASVAHVWCEEGVDGVRVHLGDGTVILRPVLGRGEALAVAAFARAAAAVSSASIARIERACSDLEADERQWERVVRACRVETLDRRSLALQVEDGVSQQLTALRLTSRLARSGDVDSAWIDAWERLLARASDDARSLSARLRAGGSACWLRTSIEASIGTTPFDVDLQLPYLHPRTESTLAKVAFETVDNVVRHAKARRGAVAAWSRAADVVMVVEDDGIGGDPGAFTAASSGGLRRVSRWVASAGGSVSIAAHRGRGTQVHVRMPIDVAAHSGSTRRPTVSWSPRRQTS